MGIDRMVFEGGQSPEVSTGTGAIAGTGQARPHEQLIAELMDPCRAHTELEWAARAELAEKDAQIERLTATHNASCDWITENWEDIERAIITLFNMPGSPLGEAKAAEMLGLDLIAFNERAKALSGTPTTAKLVPGEERDD
jgi:hypothetical protein